MVTKYKYEGFESVFRIFFHWQKKDLFPACMWTDIKRHCSVSILVNGYEGVYFKAHLFGYLNWDIQLVQILSRWRKWEMIKKTGGKILKLKLYNLAIWSFIGK
ncbi:hypothetical protein BH20BAC1_BH20BAC1_13350 [soil metagenome]